MTKREFIGNSLMMGIGFPFLSSVILSSCSSKDSFLPKLQTDFTGDVIIVGAGAAGLSAGYLLKRYGVNFKILEAAPMYGGRIKKLDDFADFPIDLGAEWIHTNPKVLAEISDNHGARENIDIIDYNPKTIKSWNNGKLKSHNYIRYIYSEWKFKSSTWYDFFDQFIAPEISDQIVLDKVITEINYGTDRVSIKTSQDEVFEADKILITTSIKTLQNNKIDFNPSLPKEKMEAINKVYMGDGIKIFIEFKEKFYPDMLIFGNIFHAFTEENKFVYDAAFGKESKKCILGLFAINEKALAYTKLSTEEEIINKFLGELDSIFEGKATKNYVKHIIQDWSKEPFIEGAYSYSLDGNKKEIVKKIQESVMGKIYFAGEALSIENQSMVHGACGSAYGTIARMMNGE